jgi:long-chain acyl-CoA synthetase
MIPMLAAGGKLVFVDKWEPERAMELIQRERITSAGGVPTIVWELLEHPALDKYDLSSLESIGYGGAPAAAELVRRVKEKFPNTTAGTGWGMTEASGAFTNHQAEDYELRPSSCGPALPIGDMKIMDEAGKEFARGWRWRPLG